MRERVLTYLFNIACTVFFGLLFFYSLTSTGYVPLDLSTELISFRQDNILLNCIWLLAVFAGMGGLYVLVKKFEHRLNTRVIAIGTAISAMLISLYWIINANVAPEADQWNVSFYANVFNEGDFSGFEKGKYIATCPHQLGIVTLLRIVYGILGPDRFAGFRIISVISVGVIVYVGYELVRKFTRANAFAEIVYLLLAVLCFPLHVYTLFIYGEVPSTAVLFIAAWLLVSCLERFHWGKVIGLVLCAGLSVQLRQNSLVVLLGFLVVLLVKAIQKFHWKQLVLMAAIPAGIIAGNMVIKGIYSEHFKEDAVAIPNMLYITMGTNWEEANPGWFSGYNYDVFFENYCDPEASSQVAKEDLKAFIEYCLENPAYALEFYEQKFAAQWNEPMYQSLVMNCKIVEEQNPVMDSFYFVVNFKKKQGIEVHVLMVGIFGGFLFSLLWEAKTRYVFPYFVMMLPYAALGIEQMVVKVHASLGRVWKNKKSSK